MFLGNVYGNAVKITSRGTCDGGSKTTANRECCEDEYNGPCEIGQGDCDGNDECSGALICGHNNCNSNFWSSADCCTDICFDIHLDMGTGWNHHWWFFGIESGNYQHTCSSTSFTSFSCCGMADCGLFRLGILTGDLPDDDGTLTLKFAHRDENGALHDYYEWDPFTLGQPDSWYDQDGDGYTEISEFNINIDFNDCFDRRREATSDTKRGLGEELLDLTTRGKCKSTTSQGK